MTTTDLDAALIASVPRYADEYENVSYDPSGSYVKIAEVLAALSRALDPAMTERAGEVVQRLQAEKSVVSTTRTFPSGDERDMVLVPHYGPNPLANAAADLITTLLAQNAALTAERDAAREQARMNSFAGEGYVFMQQRAEAAEAEVEKLRGALKDILDTGGRFGSAAHMANVDAIARAALATEADNG